MIEAPTVANIKAKHHSSIDTDLECELPAAEMVRVIALDHMKFDKHGPLDLILYQDGHEEPRKWARNRIREMKPNQLVPRLQAWEHCMPLTLQPDSSQLLSLQQLNYYVTELLCSIDQIPLARNNSARLPTGETISSVNAYRSLRQLVVDLGEAITRCDGKEAFVSTSLFLFWTVDELCQLQGEYDVRLQQIGQALLAHYVTATLIVTVQNVGSAKSHTAQVHTQQPVSGEKGLFSRPLNIDTLDDEDTVAISGHATSQSVFPPDNASYCYRLFDMVRRAVCCTSCCDSSSSQFERK